MSLANLLFKEKPLEQLQKFIFLVFILIKPQQLSITTSNPHFVVWNVGQGQWISSFEPNECIHFDMGGHYVSWDKVKFYCQTKRNQIFLTHGDSDHMNKIKNFKYFIDNTCLQNHPVEKLSVKKNKILKSLKKCNSQPNGLNIIHSPKNKSIKTKKSSNNSMSFVYSFKQILIPGDSEITQEKTWARNKKLKSIKYLILGHHGSRTSTSQKLIDKLPSLNLSLVSSRKRTYGHPHSSVINRLQKNRIPLLSTEHWGNIFIH